MNKKSLVGVFLSISILVAAFAPGALAFWPFDGWVKKGEVKAETTEAMSVPKEATSVPKPTTFAISQYNQNMKTLVSNSLTQYKQLSSNSKVRPSGQKLVQLYTVQSNIDTWTTRLKDELIKMWPGQDIVAKMTPEKNQEFVDAVSKVREARSGLVEAENNLLKLFSSPDLEITVTGDPKPCKTDKDCSVSTKCTPVNGRNICLIVETTEIPSSCTSWFDGCNTCSVKNGAISGCTKKACKGNTGTPRCLKTIPTREGTGIFEKLFGEQ